MFMFYFILNFRQLSYLNRPCFRYGFLVVIKGDSHYVELFDLYAIIEDGRRLETLEVNELETKVNGYNFDKNLCFNA